MNCLIPECGRPAASKNLCQVHYRLHRLGLEMRPIRRLAPRSMSLKERISSRVQLDLATGCWEWNDCRDKAGYGRMTYNGFTDCVHRFAFQAHIGPIPADLIVCHKCDNPPCCNPAHLFLGTHLTNAQDKVAKRRHPKHSATTCARGHEWTPQTTKFGKQKNGSLRRRCLLCSRENSAKQYANPEYRAKRAAYHRMRNRSRSAE